MFICEKCLEKYNRSGVAISYGVCEDCGETKGCCDIPSKYLIKRDKDGNWASELMGYIKIN